jgi:hypothetical protein
MASIAAHEKQDMSLCSPTPVETIALPTQPRHNAHVTIEEYMYWAAISRHEESKLPKLKGPISNILSFGKNDAARNQSPDTLSDAPMQETKRNQPASTVISDGEWQQAQSAARTAGWAAIFYLIATDVLGPYSVPWAMAQMGYGPGISLYTVFGALAGYTGWQVCYAVSTFLSL